jgi:beta-glucosidase
MILGEAQNMSGETASRSKLELPGKQQQLLEAVVATGKPVIFVLLNGGPLNIGWASEHVPAILEAWYPGSQGGNAIVNLLYGKAVPGGKLPFTWHHEVWQVPISMPITPHMRLRLKTSAIGSWRARRFIRSVSA